MLDGEVDRPALDWNINGCAAANVDDINGEGEDFPYNFQKYMEKELCWWREKDWFWRNFLWIFWSRVEPEPPLTFPDCNSDFISEMLTASRNFEELIKHALEEILCNSPYDPLLIQFWAPLKTEGRYLLTTQNQPFALCSTDKGLCQYRMNSREYKFYLDGESEDLGLPGRVFIHRLPESTPNVEYYSSQEYPQRDHALRCHLKASLAFPVFDPSGQSCVGVIELAKTVGYIDQQIWHQDKARASKEAGLKFSNVCKHSFMHYKEKNEALTAATDEIKKVLKVVCEANELRLAHTWIPCSLCKAMDDGIFGVSSMGQVLSTIDSVYYYNDKEDEFDYDSSSFLEVCDSLHLRKGQGVAGRALLSHNLLFCTDVTQFSLAEYPFAHHARECGFRGCFAICLQSSHTGNDVYILELFVPANNESNGDLQTSLHLILGTMKLFFQTFKLASGEHLGEELPIEVIDFHNGEKFCYTLNPQTTRSPPMPEAIQYGLDHVMQLDPSDQLPMVPINNGRNVAVAEQCNVAKGVLERPQSKTGFQISLKDLQQHAGMKLKDAAKRLKVSRSTLKRICRENGIERWPPRKMKKDNRHLPIESVAGVDYEQIVQSISDVPSTQDSAAVAHTKPRDTSLEDANSVTIKAKYVNDITIKFQLSLLSGFEELQQQVAKKLNLETGTYYIKYKDEDNELILIADNEDLKYYVDTCRSMGNTSVVVLLEPN